MDAPKMALAETSLAIGDVLSPKGEGFPSLSVAGWVTDSDGCEWIKCIRIVLGDDGREIKEEHMFKKEILDFCFRPEPEAVAKFLELRGV
jgi:hypothetical protein